MESSGGKKSQCSQPDPHLDSAPTVLWLMVSGDDSVTVLAKQRGCRMSSATLHCGCSKKEMPKQTVGHYLEEMQSCGLCRMIVLIGTPPQIEELRHLLPSGVRALVSSEILQTEHEHPHLAPIYPHHH